MNDVNEEIDGLQPDGTHGNQLTSSRKMINPSDHGLVLLEFLFVTALIHELAIARRGRPAEGRACAQALAAWWTQQPGGSSSLVEAADDPWGQGVKVVKFTFLGEP